ncbi:LOW protein: M-phase inducer phosphatase-like protein [Quillaja saponaria]|uniref:LOW protein: M-phase inducer phosphatase-like protein n=1 Tax=Quillaja saponaria TaxID=32244 RepID=A0AAD7Q6A7_QUISA|nr:LOW protein: M-phase inducer phosphatase-like protein [Quillaja saponaria]
MGREWYWSGRSSKRGGGGADREPHSGCMSAVFQFFDLHPFHFPLNQQHPSNLKPTTLVPQDDSLPKGVEAPRSSLESEEGALSSITKEEESLKFPMGIQIKTRESKRAKTGNPDDNSSEISSPGPKTPTLVARLMGLDLLPDSQSPSSLSSLISSTPNPRGKPHLHPLRPRQHLQTKPRSSTDSDITSSRSLPETPRISSSRRSDVDHHHRLSLQINKENVGLSDESECHRSLYSRRKVEDHRNRSPRHYARQIVKQVKESVSRRVGLDITNTVKNREHGRRDELLLTQQFKYKQKLSRPLVKVVDESSPGKCSTPSCSPRLRFIETKNKTSTTPPPIIAPKDQNFYPIKPSSSLTANVQPQPIRVLTMPNQKSVPNCKNTASERFSSRLKKPPQTYSDIIRNKQEEPFVRPLSTTRANNIPDIKNKCNKSHALSNNIINLNNVPHLQPVKKDPSPPATKIHQKQQSQVSDTQESKLSSQLSSCSSQRYKQEARHKLFSQESEDKCNGGASTTGPCGAEFQYVSNILCRTGIDKGTRVSFTKWFSPSHPLDPSIFQQLEHCVSADYDTKNVTDNIIYSCGQLGHRCNRKLLFQVVNEILVQNLKPYMNLKPWVSSRSHNHHINEMQGSQLIDIILGKVESFPMLNCQVLEDIDELIEKDFPKLEHQKAMEFEEEGEGIVAEIEGDILDTLVHEIVMGLVNAMEWRRFGWE